MKLSYKFLQAPVRSDLQEKLKVPGPEKTMPERQQAAYEYTRKNPGFSAAQPSFGQLREVSGGEHL